MNGDGAGETGYCRAQEDAQADIGGSKSPAASTASRTLPFIRCGHNMPPSKSVI